MGSALQVRIPEAFAPLWTPARNKTFYGGRGSAKSWTVATWLVIRAATETLRVGCFREFQASIADSVHRLLTDRIETLGLTGAFRITDKSITCPRTGSEFLFKGLRNNVQEIKSTEGIDIAWVEEAQAVSEYSWLILEPTIRKAGSEIVVTFNTQEESDPTYKKFVLNPPPSSIVRKVGWQDNPWFPPELDRLRVHMRDTDPDAYDWVWEGHCRKISEAVIFRHRVTVEAFDTPPEGVRFYHGVDWGFANDPAVMIRCWIRDDILYVDEEAFGFHVELDELPAFFDRHITTCRNWPIKADAAQPAEISYIGRQGFAIEAAAKWSGNVEDGVKYLKAFKRIIVHERCKNIAQEFRLYSYKVDKQTGDILPIIVDRWNHGIDALRYALDGLITQGGEAGIWGMLGRQMG